MILQQQLAISPTGIAAITGDILTETFDNTTDYDNSGWSASGTVNPNYTGTVLEGTQSLLLTGTSAEASISRTFTDRSSVYVYFQFRTPNLPSGDTIICFLADAALNNYDVRLYVKSDGSVYIICGGSADGPTSGVLSANTTYHFWLTYIKGTGANAVANVGFSTTGVRPTSGSNYASIADGSITLNVGFLRIVAEHVGGTWTPIFDRVALNSTQIGNAP